MKLAEFKDRRVAILGYGREGKVAHSLLHRYYPDLPLTVFTGDSPVSAAAAPGPCRFHPGLPDAAALTGFDVAIRSPGISPYLPALRQARQNGLRLTSGTAIWFAEHPDACVVAITGTKGKSTTAALTAHLLRHAGKKSALGGNIGVPLLELMNPEPEPEVWVMELSSYQIHGLDARPSIAVVLNLFPEHLDWHGSDARYYADKLSLLEGLGDNTAIINRADENLCTRLPELHNVIYFNSPDAIHARDNAVCDGGQYLFDLDTFKLPGAHNRSNLCAALSILKCLGQDPASAAEAVSSFQPLPHRLQSLGWRGGVEYVDDSISTTPHSTIAAVECYPGRAVTLLAGGYDRGVDWEGFAQYARTRPIGAVIAFGAAGPRIARALGQSGAPGAAAPRTERAAGLADAVALAKSLTPAGGVVLLSPGAPSFDEFKDYVARGNAFAGGAGFAANATAGGG